MKPFATRVAEFAGWQDDHALNIQDYASKENNVRDHEVEHGSFF
jgi:hypothetical protein